MLKELQIDPEFRDLIPPLKPDEYKDLEENFIEVGFESGRGKIITWNGVIIDGHNRYEICQKHDIKFETEEVSRVNTREEAKIWILTNQLGRRSISDAIRIDLALMKAELLKPLAKRNQSLAGGDKKSDKALLTETTKAVDAPINIRKTVADDAGVSEDTVRKYTKVKESGNDELLKQVKKGEKKIGTAYKEIADTNPNNKISTPEPEVIDVEYVEVPDTTTTNIVDGLKLQAESEYMIYRDMIDRAETDKEREEIIAKRVGLSGRSEYIKIQRMIEIRDTLESKGLNHNYLDNYLNTIHGSNNISTLMATYIKAKYDVGEKIDAINISADENIIEEATQELVALTAAYHKSISSFAYMDDLLEKMDIETLKNVRQRMEWTLDTMDNFFNKVNSAIGDGRTSPLTIEPMLNMMAEIYNEGTELEQETTMSTQGITTIFDPINTNSTKQDIIEIDLPEYREKALRDSKEIVSISDIPTMQTNPNTLDNEPDIPISNELETLLDSGTAPMKKKKNNPLLQLKSDSQIAKETMNNVQ